jgi:hypothetical protein
MNKIPIYIFLLSFLGCTKGEINFQQDYQFIEIDAGITRLNKSNDTLYKFRYYLDKPNQKLKEHYKIHSSITKDDFTILKLEQLDTFHRSDIPYPETRYEVVILKNINTKKIGYQLHTFRLTKNQIDTIEIDINSLKDKFFFTFFGDAYYKEVSTMRQIKTKKDVEEIIEEMRKAKYEVLFDRYKRTNITDLWESGFASEFLNRACIEKGFNPIGASKMMDKFRVHL